MIGAYTLGPFGIVAGAIGARTTAEHITHEQIHYYPQNETKQNHWDENGLAPQGKQPSPSRVSSSAQSDHRITLQWDAWPQQQNPNPYREWRALNGSLNSSTDNFEEGHTSDGFSIMQELFSSHFGFSNSI